MYTGPLSAETLHHLLWWWTTATTFAAVLCTMQDFVAAGGRDFNYRVPPSSSPDGDTSYSFRTYMTDILLWIMLADLQPHQQCVAIVTHLGGSARDTAHMITPQEIDLARRDPQRPTPGPRFIVAG